LEGLFLNGKRRIVNTTIFKEVLFSFLDFDNEMIAVVSLTVNIKNGFTIDRSISQFLSIFKGQISNVMVVGEESIEEVNQYSFIRFGAEDAFEAKVGEETDVFVLQVIRHSQFG